MKTFLNLFLLICILLCSGISVANEKYRMPTLSPSEVTELIKDYIKEQHPDLELEKYEVGTLNYDFIIGKWSSIYTCKAGQDFSNGCHFTVDVSDSKPTKFRFWGGM